MSEDTWYSVPEVGDILGIAQRDVRNMLADNRLIALRRGESRALSIPSLALIERGGQPEVLASLRGTLITLKDARYSDEEAWAWLTTENAELGERPIDALRSGRVHAVRRVCAMLAF